MLSFIPSDISRFRGPFGHWGSPDGAPPGAGRLIMWLLIASLAVGIAGLLAFFMIVRLRSPQWPPPGTPPLPATLWVSTLLIVLSSVTMHLAVLAAGDGRKRTLRHSVTVTLALALLFVLSQWITWSIAYAGRMPPNLNALAMTFYVFTGAHALHVLGGVVPLALVTWNAWRGYYTPTRHQGVVYCAMYWHFVDAAWLVLFAAIAIGA